MCLPNFLQIALCVLQFSHFVGNRAVLQTLVGNRSQSGRTMHTLKHPLCFIVWWIVTKIVHFVIKA